MRCKLNQDLLAAMCRGEYTYLADTKVIGLIARLHRGKVRFDYRYGQKWHPIGFYGRYTLDQARTAATVIAGDIAAGRDPKAKTNAARELSAVNNNTIDKMLDAFIQVHVRKLASAGDIESALDRHIRPRLGAKSIYRVSSADVADAIDDIEKTSGRQAADRSFAWLRAAFNWQMKRVRDGKFRSPIIRGMRKVKSSSSRRFLSHQEIRDIWCALDTAKIPPCAPRFVRALLLSGQRRDEVSGTLWKEVEPGQNIWKIPVQGQPNSQGRGKSGNIVPMTTALWREFGQPQRKGYVFSNDGGKTHFSGYSKAKKALDAEVNRIRRKEKRSDIPKWRLHDLRHTVRTLLSEAGVPEDIAERVVGHKKTGIRAVYDHWQYLPEKRDALEKLAAKIEEILSKGRP